MASRAQTRAITTSGLTTLTVFTRLAKGTIQVQNLSPHSFLVMGLATAGFVLSAMLFGQVASGQVNHMSLTPPLASLALAGDRRSRIWIGPKVSFWRGLATLRAPINSGRAG